MALLAELTHRCPLQCPYCSNPLDLLKANAERDTNFWKDVIDQAAALGVLQIHFSGGEPTLRRDLPALVAHASEAGLYTNLITSAVLLDEARLAPWPRPGWTMCRSASRARMPRSPTASPPMLARTRRSSRRRGRSRSSAWR